MGSGSSNEGGFVGTYDRNTCIRGDVNGDMVVDRKDVTDAGYLYVQSERGREIPSSRNCRLDCNGDGMFSDLDVHCIEDMVDN